MKDIGRVEWLQFVGSTLDKKAAGMAVDMFAAFEVKMNNGHFQCNHLDKMAANMAEDTLLGNLPSLTGSCWGTWVVDMVEGNNLPL